MFTGIVEETGRIEKINPGADGIQLIVSAKACASGVKAGESMAVNGCCLTIEKKRGHRLQFSILQESWRLTNLQFARPGAAVNLERALRVGDRLGGHFVSGHIDGLGRISRWEKSGRDYVLEIAVPPEILRYIILKGSIAVDGISLTVAGVKRGGFAVWIIPHTRNITALRERKVGDAVNIEVDLIGKFVEKLVTAYPKKA